MNKKQDNGTGNTGITPNSGRFRDFLRTDLWMMLLDILAVNVSYLCVLYMRFFVAGEMNLKAVVYPDRFCLIAPFYTVAAIVTFFLFKLYHGIWEYMAINDINRIIFANLTTMVLHILISVLVLAVFPQSGRQVNRMPLSYYFLGSFFQFILVFLNRFSQKLFRQEKERIIRNRQGNVPALVIGSAILGVKTVRHLQNNTMFRVVSILGKDAGRMFDGIPVYSMNDLEKVICEKGIKAVFIADKSLSKAERETIRAAAEGLEINDFTGYMSNQSGFLPLTNLLEVTAMPVTVEMNGITTTFSSAEECLEALPGEYDVVSVHASKLILKKHEQDESWMKVYQEQTGQQVSFF